MKKHGTFGRASIWTAGVIFAATGGILVLVCLTAALLRVFPAGFAAPAILGPVFLTLGAAMLLTDAKKNRIARELMDNGRYVWGEIVSIERNALLRVNGSYPWFVRVRWFDGSGNVYMFESRGHTARKLPNLVGRRVKVYVDGDYRRSHVDLESIE